MARALEHNKRLEVRLSNTSLDILKKACKKQNMSISEFVRNSIDNRLNALKMNSK